MDKIALTSLELNYVEKLILHSSMVSDVENLVKKIDKLPQEDSELISTFYDFIELLNNRGISLFGNIQEIENPH